MFEFCIEFRCEQLMMRKYIDALLHVIHVHNILFLAVHSNN